MDMRGLSIFISDVRKCQTKEEERKRVEKELAKVRAKFRAGSKLKGYDRKKYVSKLLYIYMLGYEIDFGHMEAVHLLSSEKYSEKHIGYLACTLLLNENHELVTLITNSIKRDLNRKDSPYDQCLALTAISNLGGKEQAEALASDVQTVLMKPDTKLLVKKKAAITLLRLFRKYPEIVPPESWGDRMLNLLDGKDLGVMTSVMSLLLGFVEYNEVPFQVCVEKVINNLGKIVLNKEFSQNYLYYGIPAPWLQVKMFRFLQFFEPPTDQEKLQYIIKIIHHTITHSERVKTMEKGKTFARTNAIHAVLFEALNLAIHYDNNENMLLAASQKLSRYLGDKEPNLRYLGLDTMSRLAYSKIKSVKNSIRKHQNVILLALKDADISIRRKALDLLYSMCNKTNASQIVGELLAYLPNSNFELREELVLKIAILAEKFAVDFTWYVDVILNLIVSSGDFVTDDIWYRVIQIVTNRDEELKQYAAKTVLNAISGKIVHENAIKVAAYILGEFGDLISDSDGCSGLDQFNMLNSKFNVSSTETKQMLLNTYIKLYNLYENSKLRKKILKVFKNHKGVINVELQQRANEYLSLTKNVDNDRLLEIVLDNIPPFPEKESSFLKKIKEKIQQTRALKKEKKNGEEELEQEEEEEEEGEEREGEGERIEREEELKGVGKIKETTEGLFDLGEKNKEKNLEKKPKDTGKSILDMDDLFSVPKETTPYEPSAPSAPVMNQSQLISTDIDDIFSSSTSSQINLPQSVYPNPKIENSGADFFDSVFGNSKIQNTVTEISPKKVEEQTKIEKQPEPEPEPEQELIDFAQQAASIGQQIQSKREQVGISIQEQMSKQKEEDEFSISQAVHEDAENRFSSLLMSKGGTVIEDRFVEVSVQTEFHSSQGRLHIIYKNKTSSPITQVRTSNIVPPELKCSFTQITPIIHPNSTVQQYIKCECLQPFNYDSYVHCSLFFQVEKKNIKFQFKLPISVHRFIEPSQDILNAEQFFGIWNSIEKGSQKEAQSIVQPKNGTNLNLCKDVLTTRFRMSLLNNIDKKPGNVVAAGNFHFTTKSVPVLVRLETNPKAYRLTVRSHIPLACSSIQELIRQQIDV